MSAELPYPVEIRCPGPEHCPDDLCANSDVGLCGIPRRDDDHWAEQAYDDDWWPEDDE